jgi:hypothetical protein
MPDWSLVRGPHVLMAIDECDRIGAKDFRSRYGLRGAHAFKLWRHGNEYDSTAILAAAYLRATGHPATWDEPSGGEHGAAEVLTGLGFDVVAEEQPVVAPRARKPAPAPARKRATAPEPVVTLCPRCHVAVPATGICDYCD